MPKHPCLNGIEDHYARAILVLASGCDSLTSGLTDMLGSKWCYKVSLLLRKN